MKYVIDIDGTLCTKSLTGKYDDVKPIVDVICAVNVLWTMKNEIVIFTARGMNSCSGNVLEAEKKYRDMTLEWLDENRVLYDELLFGKPSADIYVDDKLIDPFDFVEVARAAMR